MKARPRIPAAVGLVVLASLAFGPASETARAQQPPVLPARIETQFSPVAPAPPREHLEASLRFAAQGHTVYGDWQADVSLDEAHWQPGRPITVRVTLKLLADHLAAMARAGIKVDQVCVLATAERAFDADGWMRLPSDERMSTLLTPTGLAIEGGIQGAVTDRYGYPFRTPLDQFQQVPAASMPFETTFQVARFTLKAVLPADLPPGLYRLRLDFGVTSGSRLLNINGFSFATRPFSDQEGTVCYAYSPVFPASGRHASGRAVDAATIQARMPWVLLGNYNSNGYQGVVADEDRAHFALSPRTIIPDEVVLPLFDISGNRLAYSLEPQFPTEVIDPRSNIAWTWSSGELTLSITSPDGVTNHVGTARFVARGNGGPTTRNAAFSAWKPPMYGRYTVRATGWIADQSGRRFEGGGTYRFWIAKRMTMATATFQGMPYPVGSKYGRDIGFAPPVPADVRVEAVLYPDSDQAQARSLVCSGRATAGGTFGTAQGMKQLTLDAPGEYHARVLATYTDPQGHLWVCVMRHAGVVYRDDAPIVAHGKKILIAGQFVERGETKTEGYVEADGTLHLQHVTFPYNAGDVLLIASEGQGANKIEPVLTYAVKGEDTPWDPRLRGVGTTNLFIRTANGYSPHLFPEYITDLEYYIGSGPRPGFMSRFVVGESTVRAPYWPVSPNAFGGQIGASANGDLPGDIYRLLGGVVMRDKGKVPVYAGYIASAFLLPKGTNNNRIIAAGSEDLIGSTGDRARFFLVGLRPGMAYEVGATFRPVAQIDPLLPVNVHFVLTYPDGRQKVADGVGDAFGSWAGPEVWPLDVSGIYRYQMSATWNGFTGTMPGLPAAGGEYFVFPKDRPAGVPRLAVDLPGLSVFSPTAGLRVTGRSSADTVRYALIMPGAVIAQGDLKVSGGRFEYFLDPQAIHDTAPIYDIVNDRTGKAEIGRVLHLTFFANEKGADGATAWDFRRVVVRGTTVVNAP